MEVDQVKIGTKFMKDFLSGIISKILREKLEQNIEIRINDAEITNQAEKVHVHLDVDAEISTRELEELLTKFNVI